MWWLTVSVRSSQAAGGEVKDELGIVGTIRSLEVTCGPNGWHPHLHVLIFAGADVEWVQDGWTPKGRRRMVPGEVTIRLRTAEDEFRELVDLKLGAHPLQVYLRPRWGRFVTRAGFRSRTVSMG